MTPTATSARAEHASDGKRRAGTITLLAFAVLVGCGGTALPPAAVVDEPATIVATPRFLIEPTYTGTSGRKVAVLGDSITRVSASLIHDQLADHQVRVVAKAGTTVAKMRRDAATFADDPPDVAVINLGTNDMWNATTPPTDALDSILAMFPESCIVLVTINTIAYNPAADDPSAVYSPLVAIAYNQAMASRADQTVDWDRMVQEHHEFATEGLIHPSEIGKAALASAIRDATAACDAPGPRNK